ncbi:MAG: ATP-binding cassette domain-containing protein [Bacteroidales bacterium]
MNNRYIEVNDVNLSYGAKSVLRDVAFTIDRSDFLAVTGPNGGGKTSLIRIMLGLIKPSSGTVKYYKDGLDENRLNVGYLPQKSTLDMRFPISVKELVASGLIDGHTDNDVSGVIDEKVADMLSTVGLTELSRHQIGEVSGGQFQRALLARAVISEPELLVLDEPTSYLDKFFEDKVFSMLEGLSQHCTIVIVSHDTARIGDIASKIISVQETVTEVTHALR